MQYFNIALLMLSSLFLFNEQSTDKTENGYIFVGDSRFVGMDNVCDIESISDNYFVVAKESMGYNWLVNTAIDEIEDIVKENSDIEEWFLVCGLGVNDLYNVDKYCDYYSELSEDYNIVFVTVNPVEYSKYVTNDNIEKFNKTLSSFDFVQVDTYSKLLEDGFSTVDGLHYTVDTYKSIFTILDNELLDK